MRQNSDKFLQLAKSIPSKRARTVIEHIAKHGQVTTEDLEKMGYSHPPRAVRDVRENGIPIITFRTKSDNGKSIAAYKFGDPSDIQQHKLGGRRTFPKSLKNELLKRQNGKCAICNEPYDEKYLQIDHRIPYEFSGDPEKLDADDYMLLCAECNRKKDRATEVGCKNTCFKTNDLDIIKSCFWASPENYTHICMKPIRRVDLSWSGNGEVEIYERLLKKSKADNVTMQEYIKKILKEHLN